MALLYGARRALDSQKRRFPARAVSKAQQTGTRLLGLQHAEGRTAELAPLLLSLAELHQVRKTPSWPRSWANSSLLQLCSHRNARADLHISG